MEDKPIAPNFFLQVKGPYGSIAIARRQARYDGAIGARAMHSLQNYSNDGLVFDSKAYTFSSTYCSGQLVLYAHHVTAPITPRGWPQYHMTKLRGFELTDTRETFIEGVTAFRNARDLADRYRQEFIEAANAKARWSSKLVGTKVQQQYKNSEEYAAQSSQDMNKASAIPHYLEYNRDKGREYALDVARAPAANFTTSFTSCTLSDNTGYGSRSKRRRAS
jgi:hypothetical protein